jgi:hypothetical protein
LNKEKIINFVFWLLIVFIFFRFFRFIVWGALRFWFVSVPLIILIYFLIKKKKKKIITLDPEKEIKIYPEPKIEDDQKE